MKKNFNSKTNVNDELLSFIDNSPNCFFAVKNLSNLLEENNFNRLYENEHWNLKKGCNYYITRNDSSLIAFKVPSDDFIGFQIIASHSDSPALKIKPNAEIVIENQYTKLNVEKYGGMVLAPWFDRPLSVAGRVVIDDENTLISKLINIDEDLLIIPNLAIHMNRQINEGYTFNVQKDLLPLLGDSGAYNSFMDLIAKQAGTTKDKIISTDLFLYVRTKGTYIGIDKKYLASARLDDLQCAFASIKGLIQATPGKSIALSCIYDNEEVGSTSKQGAASTFLKDIIKRINLSFNKNEEDYFTEIASSFMVSADNAHGVHPNHTDKSDPVNRPYLNGGIVIKYSANQKYTTDAVSSAIFKKICEKVDVPYQTFVNRSDMLGGSTLGNISTSQVAIDTVDIGLPMLAMHSSYETAGSKDTEYLIKAATCLYSSHIQSEKGMKSIVFK